MGPGVERPRLALWHEEASAIVGFTAARELVLIYMAAAVHIAAKLIIALQACPYTVAIATALQRTEVHIIHKIC